MTSEYMCEHKICHLRYEEHNKTHRCSLGGFFSFRLPALPALITPRAGGFWSEQVGFSYLFGKILPTRGVFALRLLSENVAAYPGVHRDPGGGCRVHRAG